MSAKSTASPSIFDLSYRGDLPKMLRQIADHIETKNVTAESFDIGMTDDHCRLSINLELHPKD